MFYLYQLMVLLLIPNFTFNYSLAFALLYCYFLLVFLLYYLKGTTFYSHKINLYNGRKTNTDLNLQTIIIIFSFHYV